MNNGDGYSGLGYMY